MQGATGCEREGKSFRRKPGNKKQRSKPIQKTGGGVRTGRQQTHHDQWDKIKIP